MGIGKMDLFERISTVLATRPARVVEPGDRLNAAVAIVLREAQTGLQLLFIERSANEADFWSGQIGFPGGKRESCDAGLRDTAERETFEELGLDLATARFLGRLDDLSPAGLPVVVSCFVYAVGEVPELHLNRSEVAHAFWFPFHELCNPSRYAKMKFPVRGRLRSFPAVRLYSEDKPPLWGISYRLFRDLCKAMKRGGV